MKPLGRIFLDLIQYFLIALFLAVVVKFVGTVLFDYNFTYRSVFWPLFTFVVLFFITIKIFISPWARRYVYQLKLGKSRNAALEAACCNVKVRPPKIILKMFEPVLFKLINRF